MRKTLLFSFFFCLASFSLVACGGSSSGGMSGTKEQPSISISPMNPNVLVGQTMQFTANIQNMSDTRVAWSVQEENGGTIASTDTGGLYTAPWPTGMYHVVATSVADSSLTTNTMVAVTAKFGFLQEYTAGDAVPFSMTPILATVGTDGNIGLAGFIDTDTGNPVSISMESVDVSHDGTKATLTLVTQDTSGYNYFDVYIANADGSGEPTQLTLDGNSWYPEFSPNGQQIVYIHNDEIWAMNANGSNQHVVLSSSTSNAWAYSATFSPDGTKIAAELEWEPNGIYQDGIAIMNADGSNAVPLTGSNLGCTGWDEMPAFTNDGTKIMFSEYCNSGDVSYDSLYTVTTDGTRAPLLGADVGIIHYNPIPAGDKIVFQSNQASPGSLAFEIYSMNSDGTGITKLTSNDVFDGFDLWWYGSTSAQQSNAKATRRATRADRIKALQQHRN